MCNSNLFNTSPDLLNRDMKIAILMLSLYILQPSFYNRFNEVSMEDVKLDGVDERVKAQVDCAKADAAKRASAASSRLSGFEQKVFRNSCLDAAEEGEMCKMALTRGYELRVTAGNTEYTYRTQGAQLRLVTGKDRGKKIACP